MTFLGGHEFWPTPTILRKGFEWFSEQGKIEDLTKF